MFFRDTSHVARSFRYVLAHQSSGAIYLDVAAGVTTFLLAGRYFEALSKRRSGNALRALSSVGAKDVAVLDATGTERRGPIVALREGDRFVVRPGETIATDGEVVFGQSAIDRSAMTGESMPADVTVGDMVLGGTACVGGRLVVGPRSWVPTRNWRRCSAWSKTHRIRRPTSRDSRTESREFSYQP